MAKAEEKEITISLNGEARKKMKSIISRLAKIRAEKKELSWEERELCEQAQQQCGVLPSVTKKLAKEAGLNQTEVAALQLYEDQLATCRVELGMLAGTPLGDAAEEAETKKSTKGNKKVVKATHDEAHA